MPEVRYLTALGIILALRGPAALSVLSTKIPSSFESLAVRAIELLAFVGLVGRVAAIAVKGERLTWSDVGFGCAAWTSFVWAAGLACFFVFVFGPLVPASLARLGVGSYNTGLAKMSLLPIWYIVLTVVAVGEEWLYRGYAVERLEVVWRSRQCRLVTKVDPEGGP